MSPGTIKLKYERPILLKSTRLPIATPKMYINKVDETRGGKTVWPATEKNLKISRFDRDKVPIGLLIMDTVTSVHGTDDFQEDRLERFILQDFFFLADAHDAAVIDDPDCFTQFFRFFHIVGG